MAILMTDWTVSADDRRGHPAGVNAGWRGRRDPRQAREKIVERNREMG